MSEPYRSCFTPPYIPPGTYCTSFFASPLSRTLLRLSCGRRA
jgi:hypothetical protein